MDSVENVLHLLAVHTESGVHRLRVFFQADTVPANCQSEHFLPVPDCFPTACSSYHQFRTYSEILAQDKPQLFVLFKPTWVHHLLPPVKILMAAAETSASTSECCLDNPEEVHQAAGAERSNAAKLYHYEAESWKH